MLPHRLRAGHAPVDESMEERRAECPESKLEIARARDLIHPTLYKRLKNKLLAHN